MKKFPWGKVIQVFDYDFDGEQLEVIKFNPWRSDGPQVLVGNENPEEVMFHNEEMRESFDTLHGLLIGWIAYQRLGDNTRSLSQGIMRALEIKPTSASVGQGG